eukprot:gene1536-12662_t
MYFDVETYSEALSELKQNSKPQINSLTMIAEENMAAFKPIVQAIEKRLKEAPNSQKLTVLYLVDSICKNVGGPFIQEFGKNIINSFCSSFEVQSDENMKTYFLKLLKTWPQIFSTETVNSIETRISSLTKKNEYNRMIHVNPNVFAPKVNSSSNFDSKETSNLIQEIQKQISEKGDDIKKNPNVLHLLSQLESHVNKQSIVGGVSNFDNKMMAPPPSSILSQQPIHHQVIPSPTKLINSLTSVGLFGSSLKPAVKELYEGYQYICSTCGLRYHSNEKYAKHLDKHFRTATSKSKTLVLSRKWYQDEKDWKEKIDTMTTESPGEIFFNQKEKETSLNAKLEDIYLIATDDINDTCPVCMETFEKNYDGKSDEWKFLNAVIDDNTNLATHLSCLEDLYRQQEEQNQIIQNYPEDEAQNQSIVEKEEIKTEEIPEVPEEVEEENQKEEKTEEVVQNEKRINEPITIEEEPPKKKIKLE